MGAEFEAAGIGGQEISANVCAVLLMHRHRFGLSVECFGVSENHNVDRPIIVVGISTVFVMLDRH